MCQLHNHAHACARVNAHAHAHTDADANATHLPKQILELPLTLEWAWELVRHFRNNGTLSNSSVDALATLAAARLGECPNGMHL